MFADAACYNKSGNKSIWAIFSSIVELPPPLRNSYENMIFHSLWSGSNPDFNNYLEKYNKEIDHLIENGFEHNNINYKIRVYVLIADAPARAKVCYTNQFNGKFGCLHCLHPTQHENHKTIYPNRIVQIRTNKSYNNDLKTALEIRTTFNGIKDHAYISLWLDIPDNVIIDPMHLCLLGTYKFMFNNFFLSKNKI